VHTGSSQSRAHAHPKQSKHRGKEGNDTAMDPAVDPSWTHQPADEVPGEMLFQRTQQDAVKAIADISRRSERLVAVTATQAERIKQRLHSRALQASLDKVRSSNLAVLSEIANKRVSLLKDRVHGVRAAMDDCRDDEFLSTWANSCVLFCFEAWGEVADVLCCPWRHCCPSRAKPAIALASLPRLNSQRHGQGGGEPVGPSHGQPRFR
jgi:hypothetical protein